MDIQKWLEDLGLSQYSGVFNENDIDEQALPQLTDDDLRDMGITSLGHRRKILDAISLLSNASSGGEAGSGTQRQAGSLQAQTGPPPASPDSTSGYRVQVGDYVSKGWKIFKGRAVDFIGYSAIVSIVAAIVDFAMGHIQGKVTSSINQISYTIRSVREIGEAIAAIMNFILGIVSSITFSALLFILFAGCFFVCFKIIKGQSTSFEDFWGGFRYFAPLALAGVVTSALETVGFLLLIIPGIYLTVAYMFTAMLIIDRKMSFWEAMETSRKAITKKWFGFLGFAIVLGLINTAGLIALAIGLLVTAPLSACALAVAYDDILGVETDEF